MSADRPAAILDGVRVLEFASYITGPYAAMLLADLGADVIKVEEPGQGDPFRIFRGDLYGPHFQAHNRGKQSLALNLRHAAAREIVDRLVSEADVLIENYRPGVAEALGIGAARVRAMNPRLVYCSISGLGEDGPGAGRPVYDTVGIGLSGLASLFMDPDTPRVMGPALGDSLTGLFAGYGIMGALTARARTGQGNLIEVNMLSATLGFLLDPASWLFTTGQTPGPLTRARSAQAYAFACADGKAFGIHLSVPPKFWQGLTEAAARPELRDDPRFASHELRVANYEVLEATLRETFRTRPRAYWLPRLERFDVPHAPINTLDEALEEAQVKHLGMEVACEHPTRGTVRTLASPVRFATGTPAAPAAPPTLGEHTEDILTRLGLDRAAIERLRADGVIR
jgi:crotonobetainyl-CoA:carnitine CoA-transferase CaiB-like acyl-CoA transferase